MSGPCPGPGPGPSPDISLMVYPDTIQDINISIFVELRCLQMSGPCPGPGVDRPQSLFYFVPQESHSQTGLAILMLILG